MSLYTNVWVGIESQFPNHLSFPRIYELSHSETRFTKMTKWRTSKAWNGYLLATSKNVLTSTRIHRIRLRGVILRYPLVKKMCVVFGRYSSLAKSHSEVRAMNGCTDAICSDLQLIQSTDLDCRETLGEESFRQTPLHFAHV